MACRKLISLFIITIMASVSCHDVTGPSNPEESDVFDACITYPGTDESLDVVTFNIEGFPKNGYTSVMVIASLLNTIDADLYALQEVASENSFNQLLKLMPDYKGLFYLINNSDWNLAYIYKSSDITIDDDATKLLFSDDSWSFPRPPFEIKIHHEPTDLNVYIINNHFKCCSGSNNEASRTSASRLLKNYIDVNRPDNAVIVLGDLNDEITGTSSSENPFLCFINDADNYEFTDMDIAKGSKLWWSYPSYPSHIDHILITNELFSKLDTTYIYKGAPCYPGYSSDISDHRPEGIRIINTGR